MLIGSEFTAKGKCVISLMLTRLDIINTILFMKYKRNVIQMKTGRLKEYDSVCKKMKKKGLESDSDSALEKINDLIGVRAICVYVDAIYRVSDYLKCIEKKCYTDENKIEVRTPELFRSITIMITDFTKEHPDRTLWRFWIPMMFSVMFQQIYNIADCMIAGKFAGEDALAAVGASYPITIIFMAFAVGMNLGASVVVSRLFGAGDRKGVKCAVTTAFASSLGLAAVLTVFGYFFSSNMMEWIHTPQNITTDGILYLKIYVFGMIFLMLYNVCTGVFTALGDSKTPLYFLLGSSAGNIILDLIFVAQFHWGVAGVAWATFIAQGISAVLALVTLFSRLRAFAGEEKQPFFDRGFFIQIFAIAVPSILQQSVLSVGNLFVQDIVNHYGSAVVAGYSGAIKLNTFAINIFMTLGSCLSSYTAQNIGAGKAERIPLGFRTGLKLSAVASVPFVVLYVGFSRQMMGLFLNAESGAAITAGMKFLQIVAPWYLMIVVKLMTDGIIRGTGAMTYFVAATVPDLIIRILFALIFSKNYGSTGIWMAWPFGWIAATVLTLIFYRKVMRRQLSGMNK